MIIFVSTNEADVRAFRKMSGQTARSVVLVPDIDGAREQIRKTRPRLVVCDTDIGGGRSWRELLEGASAPEFELIVVSRCASDALWAEVLNLGGFDLLALPFDADEVDRVVSLALLSRTAVR